MNNQEQSNLNNTGFAYGNFDPALLQEDGVILLVTAIDVSASVNSFVKEMNEAFQETVGELQKSHVAPKLMVKVITFGSKVVEKTGFMPIATMDLSSFIFKANEGSTALFAGAEKSVESAIAYKAQLEATGVNVKVLVFVITDGDDNASLHGTDKKVAKLITDTTANEANTFTFETILFGVGNDAKMFEDAQKNMGFKHLAVVGSTGKDIRNMVGFISASVSRSASNQAVTF